MTIFYVPINESESNPANIVKVLQNDSSCCLFDIDNDLFDEENNNSHRLFKLLLQCTSSNEEGTKYLSISKNKLMEFLNIPSIQPTLKSFFQTR